ncbi:helix-turn-helix transcriptional regulator [Collinsella stercoris]|uniref:DNA-binding helix-turn-helix protein n=1 Tax=Collinsella stercoris DSM 13279 TaxID=445975 RepID=B6GD11_9ACTN|nr:helix-turn-helix transcriptional regulator [Collinsella stercoris]EEA89829.1 DNA-binding helix-turn-helix protein [Collinsella stercoris DSM 13279]UEA45840.1 helix-turn-helix domain-containing protein [Collinsella stercoris DSM 13279]UWP11640.1 helix-turn-helix domain-containing protein [Collinsella stercoris]
MDISNQIKTRREAMGISQEQLAEKLYVSRQTISNWERNKTYPDVQSLLMLSILFDTSIDTLVKGDVTIMEEAVERDRKRMGAQMQWLAVLMLGLLALTLVLMLTPAFDWMESIWGTKVSYAIAVLPAVAGLVVAAVIDNIKRKNDLVTYKEILAFMNGEGEIERNPRALPRRGWAARHRLAYDMLMFLVAAAIGGAIGYVAWGLLH